MHGARQHPSVMGAMQGIVVRALDTLRLKPQGHQSLSWMPDARTSPAPALTPAPRSAHTLLQGASHTPAPCCTPTRQEPHRGSAQPPAPTPARSWNLEGQSCQYCAVLLTTASTASGLQYCPQHWRLQPAAPLHLADAAAAALHLVIGRTLPLCTLHI